MATKTPRKTKKTPATASSTPASEPKAAGATPVTPETVASVSSSQEPATGKRPTRRLPPAMGICKWVKNCFGKDALKITAQTGTGPVTEEYEVGPSTNGYALYKGSIVEDGVHPVQISVTRYDIDTVTHAPAWSCNCPDATHRPERKYTCKHVRALRAALPTAPKNLADF